MKPQIAFPWRGDLGLVVLVAAVVEGRREGGRRGVSIKAALTETQGLELVLGVGERCTVTSAIQRPGSGHLRGSDSGETSIIVLRWRETPAESGLLVLSFSPLSLSLSLIVDYLTTPRLFPLSALAAHAQRPFVCQPRLTVCVLDVNKAVMSGVCQSSSEPAATVLVMICIRI